MHLQYLSLAILALWAVSEAKKCQPAPRDPMSGEVRFGPEGLPCDLCSEFFDPTGAFMTICAPDLTVEFINKTQNNCDKVLLEEQGLFFKAIVLMCDKRGLTGVEALSEDDCPGCDQCDLLFADDSDFTLNCGGSLSPATITELTTLCDEASCNYTGLVELQRETQEVCDGVGDFIFEPCECNECIDFFQYNSDFMTACGNSLPDDVLNSLRLECAQNMLNTSDLFNFFMTVKFDNCNGAVFEFPLCDCEEKVCFLLIDGSRDFFTQCFLPLGPVAMQEEFSECEATKSDPAARETFINNLEARCFSELGVIAFVPDCSNCAGLSLDLVFLIDNSGSIDAMEIEVEKNFVSEVACAFSVSPDDTRVGAVVYATDIVSTFPLLTSNSKAEVTTFIDAISRCVAAPLQTPFPCSTNTALGIERAGEMLAMSNSSGNPKVLIVITDGISNDATATEAAAAGLPSDTLVFAVGVSGANLNELNAIAAGGNGNGRSFFTNDFAGLSMTIRALREEVCPTTPTV